MDTEKKKKRNKKQNSQKSTSALQVSLLTTPCIFFHKLASRSVSVLVLVTPFHKTSTRHPSHRGVKSINSEEGQSGLGPLVPCTEQASWQIMSRFSSLGVRTLRGIHVHPLPAILHPGAPWNRLQLCIPALQASLKKGGRNIRLSST